MILITGASGFLGRHLAQKFVQEGHRVRCTTRDPAKALFLREQRIEVVSGDLSLPHIASECAKDADAIIHAAGQLGGWGKKESFIRNNVVATQNLLDAAVGHRVKRFVYISSATSYGRQPGRSLTEDSPVQHEADPYCETKLRCEEIVRSYSNIDGS